MAHGDYADAQGGALEKRAWLDSADSEVPRYERERQDGGRLSDSTATLHRDDAHDRLGAEERAWRGKASVEEWRSTQLDRRESDARSTRTGGSGRSGTTRGANSLGGLDEADLASMTDADIAQHHFRLAQQHLEAAQRLALAAAAAPARPPPSAPSSTGSSRGHRVPPAHWQDSASSSGYGDSAYGRDELQFSPITPTTDLESDFARLSVKRDASASYQEQRRSSLSGAKAGSPLYTSQVDLPSLKYSSSPSSLSLRSAPSSQPRHPHDVAGELDRPQPAPRRVTLGSGMSMTPLESASSLAPSLYGGGLPAGVADRLGVRGASTGSSPAVSLAPSRSNAFSSSSTHSAHPRARPSLETLAGLRGDSDAGHGDGGFDDDDDDARSDFFDAQSTFSHVTNSPLPGYSEQFDSLPAVPHIPARYLQPSTPIEPNAPALASAPPASAATPASPDDEFHGFRPRHAVRAAPGSAIPWTPVAAPPAGVPAHTAARPAPPPQPSAPSAPIYASPALSTHGLQPHSYIIGADGRPIPVYASVGAPPAHPLRAGQAAAASRATLPIHSQPLQFDHSLPYAQQASSVGGRPAVAPLSTQALHPPPGASLLQPYSPHASPLTPSSVPTLSTHASASSLSALAALSRASSSETHVPTRAPSIASRSRMASLRAAVKSPHVRFMSPSPEARSRASEPAPARARRGMFGGGGGGEERRPPAAEKEKENKKEEKEHDKGEESEEECRKRQRAMQQSLGMLL
ncbi:hypothetical protein JCM10450v2_007563 [Rhodotorula kratochvilovae]